MTLREFLTVLFWAFVGTLGGVAGLHLFFGIINRVFPTADLHAPFSPIVTLLTWLSGWSGDHEEGMVLYAVSSYLVFMSVGCLAGLGGGLYAVARRRRSVRALP